MTMPENEKDVPVNVDNLSEDDPIETPMERFFYHQRRALEETGKALEALLPPDFKRHGGEASREFAKGFRVLVDATIDELKKVSERDIDDEDYDDDEYDDDDDNNDDDPPASTGNNKVKIKVD